MPNSAEEHSCWKARWSPSRLPEAVVKGLEEEHFLILPHPEVLEYIRRKAGDYDRWLRGMRRLQASLVPIKAHQV